jgi:hypothetical protein
VSSAWHFFLLLTSPSLLPFRFQQPIGNWRTKKRNVEAIPEIAAAAAKKKNIGKA